MTDELSMDFATVDAQLAERPVAGGGRPDEYLVRGEPVPSVTTVLDEWKPGGVDALMGWAAKLARKGEDWRCARDTAADRGNAIHALVERINLGECIDDVRADAERELGDVGRHAIDEYRLWWAYRQPRWLHVELPLVSERHGYGGTLDGVYIAGADHVTLWDLKTSPRCRESYVAQIGGYAQLMSEVGMCWPDAGEVLCVPKTGRLADAHRAYPFSAADVRRGRDAFLRALDLWRDAREFARLVA